MIWGGSGRAVAVAAALCALFAAFGDAANAQNIDVQALENTPALITADELTYDEENGLVIARGNVEIAQSDRVLLADEVTYNINEDIVTAEGNITLVEPSGDTVFADFWN